MLAYTPDQSEPREDDPIEPDPDAPGSLPEARAALAELRGAARRALRALARDTLAHVAERLERGCARIDCTRLGALFGCGTRHGGLARFSMALDEMLGLGVWTDLGPERWRRWQPVPHMHFLAPRATWPYHPFRLSRRDSELVADALLSPPTDQPNQALLDAARDYREAVERGEITSVR